MSERAGAGHPAYGWPFSRGDLAFDGDRGRGAPQGRGEAASDPDTPHLLDAVLRENEALQAKMAQISRSIHGLVTDLATARRECRRKQREIESLRGENAALKAAAPTMREERVLRVRRGGATGGVEDPERPIPSMSAGAGATDGPATAGGDRETPDPAAPARGPAVASRGKAQPVVASTDPAGAAAGGAACSRSGGSRTPTTDRHLAAVAGTLSLAEKAAQRGDYAEALAWLATVEAVDGELPDGYEARRSAWAAALGSDGRRRSPFGGGIRGES